MMDTLLQGAAIALAATIFIRAICVAHGTHPGRHHHWLQFAGFGYSYVILAAGAVFAAIEICSTVAMGDLPLWLLLVGSGGLIVFDRRSAKCWTIDDCPARPEGEP